MKRLKTVSDYAYCDTEPWSLDNCINGLKCYISSSDYIHLSALYTKRSISRHTALIYVTGVS